MKSSSVPLNHLLGALDRVEPFQALSAADQVRSLATAVERAALDQGQAITSDQALSAAAAQLADNVDPALPSAEPKPGWRSAWRRFLEPVPNPELHYKPSPPGSLVDFPLQLQPEPATERDRWVERFEHKKKFGDYAMILGMMGGVPSLMVAASHDGFWPSACVVLFLSLFGLGVLNNRVCSAVARKKCGPDTIHNHAPMIARHRYAMKLHAFDEAILVKASRSEEVGDWCKAHILAHLSAHHPGWSLRH